MTALFGAQSALAARLLQHARCILEFQEYAQAYRVPCATAELAVDDSFYQATYWHNHLFNPISLPPSASCPLLPTGGMRRAGASPC